MFFKNFRSYQLAIQFFHHAKKLPIKGELKDQLHRATSSIVLNLAEGAGKFHYPAEAKRFYRIAFASLRESQGILEIIENVNSEILEISYKLAAHLYKLTI